MQLHRNTAVIALECRCDEKTDGSEIYSIMHCCISGNILYGLEYNKNMVSRIQLMLFIDQGDLDGICESAGAGAVYIA